MRICSRVKFIVLNKISNQTRDDLSLRFLCLLTIYYLFNWCNFSLVTRRSLCVCKFQRPLCIRGVNTAASCLWSVRWIMRWRRIQWRQIIIMSLRISRRAVCRWGATAALQRASLWAEQLHTFTFTWVRKWTSAPRDKPARQSTVGVVGAKIGATISSWI